MCLFTSQYGICAAEDPRHPLADKPTASIVCPPVRLPMAHRSGIERGAFVPSELEWTSREDQANGGRSMGISGIWRSLSVSVADGS